MKRRVILLSLSGLAVLGIMLALSWVTAQPVVAQTPEPACISDTLDIEFNPASLDTPPLGNMVYTPTDTTCLCMRGTYTLTMGGAFNYDFGSDACYMWYGATSMISDAVSMHYQPNPFVEDPGCSDGGMSGAWSWEGWAGRDMAVITVPFALGAITTTWRGEELYPFHVSNSGGILAGCFLTPTICGCRPTGVVTQALSCMNFDYHFIVPTSWQSGGGATWSMLDPTLGIPGPGMWTLLYGSYIKQSIMFSATGTYSVTIKARALYGIDPMPEIGILINDVEVGSVAVPSLSFSEIVTVITIDSTYGEFKLTPTGGVVVDFACVTVGTVGTGLGPCGITQLDMANSARYVYDSKMESGIALPIPTIGEVGIPMGFSFGADNGYNLLRGWRRAFTVNPIAALGDFEGLLRSHDSGAALGLVPFPIGPNLAHDFSAIGEFNIVLRQNRQYGNTRLRGNGVEYPNAATPGTWSDASVYIPGGGSGIELAADCGDSLNICTEPAGIRSLSAVNIDDVYIVPGPEIICGAMAPMTTPVGSCINPNPDFILGNADWQLSGGAYIDNVYGWAVLPGGSTLQQQVPTGGAWGQAATGINVGYSYVIAVGAHLEHANQPGQFTVMVGASQPGQLSFNHQMVDPVTSMESTDMFTVTSDMLNGTSFDIRIANEAGGTVMLDYVCIRYNGGPGILPPVGQCLGSWTTSDGSENAVGPEIPPNNYVKNIQAAMGGGYTVDLAGATDDEAGSTFTLDYCNDTSEICDSIGAIPIVQDFASSFSFVVPAGGYYGGEIRLNNDDGVTYTNLCLRQSQNGPTPPTPSPPPLPFPECGSVNNTASFYMLPPYSVTSEYTGTEFSAAYLSELTYNYAIYPLVCTTISIGNWQYRTYAEFKALFNQYVAMMTSKLDTIIEILLAILDKIGTGTGGNPWWWDLLSIFLWLIKMLLDLLIRIIGFIFQLVVKFVKIFGNLSGEARGENALMFDLSCANDGQWMCFVLAGIAELDYSLGDWLNTVSLIVVAMLTVSLVFWIVNQVRDMMQPGSGGDTSG